MYFTCMKTEEITDLKTAVELYCGALQKIGNLEEENSSLKSQLDWFKRQVFGSKSEKITIEIPEQTVLNLFDEPVEIPALENHQTGTVTTEVVKKNGGKFQARPQGDSRFTSF